METAEQGDGSTAGSIIKMTVDLSTIGSPVKTTDNLSTAGIPVDTTGDGSAELRKNGTTGLIVAAKDADTTKEHNKQRPPKAPAGADGSYSAAVLNINGSGAVSFHIPGKWYRTSA